MEQRVHDRGASKEYDDITEAHLDFGEGCEGESEGGAQLKERQVYSFVDRE